MLLRHSIAYVLARGLPGAAAFASVIVFTRMLDPDAYGRYSLILAGVVLCATVTYSWLKLSTLRFWPRFKDRRRQRFLGSIRRKFGLATLIGLPFALAWGYFGDGQQDLVFALTAAALLPVMGWFDLNLELSRADFKPQAYGSILFTKSAAFLGLGALFIHMGGGALGLLLAAVVSRAVPALSVSRRWIGARVRSDRRIGRHLVAYGLPLTANFALNFVVGQSDRIFLGVLDGTAAVGVYSAGYTLTQHSIADLILIIHLAAYPLAINALEKGGYDDAFSQLRTNLAALLSVGVPATLGFSFLAGNIAYVVLGPEFREAATRLIPWIAVSALLISLKSYHFNLSFQLGRSTMTQVWVAGAAALVNVILNFILIPPFGYMGAAYATLAAAVVAVVTSWAFGRDIFRVPLPARNGLMIGVASVLMLLAIAPVRAERGLLALLLQIGIGVAAYSAAILAMNVLDVRTRVLARIRR